MTEETADYSGYEDKGPSVGSNELAALADLAQKQLDAEAELAAAEVEVTKAKEALREISEFQLPQLMEELGMQSFKTLNGIDISINEKLRVSLAKKRNAEGVEWLEVNGHGGSVKRCFVISFNKEDEAWANKFQRDLNQRVKKVDCVREDAIANPTLKKLVGELLEAGEDVPLELFGVHRQKFTKLTPPASKKNEL